MKLKKGSYTLEFSLLLPIIMLVLGFCVYSIGFVYQEVLMKCQTHQMAATALISLQKDYEAGVNLLSDAKVVYDGTEDSFLQQKNFSYNVDKQKIELKLSGSTKGNLPKVLHLITVTSKQEVKYPLSYIWKAKKIQGFIGEE